MEQSYEDNNKLLMLQTHYKALKLTICNIIIIFVTFCFADDNKYIVKLLIPSTVAGSIIGKGGQTIAQLQRDTGTNIKLSKANDFYPGMFILFLLACSISEVG